MKPLSRRGNLKETSPHRRGNLSSGKRKSFLIEEETSSQKRKPLRRRGNLKGNLSS
jgi:hypothetical protein